MFVQLQGSNYAVVVSDFLQKKHPRLFPKIERNLPTGAINWWVELTKFVDF